MKKKKLTANSFHDACEVLGKSFHFDTLIVGAYDGKGHHHYLLQGNKYIAFWMTRDLANASQEKDDEIERAGEK